MSGRQTTIGPDGHVPIRGALTFATVSEWLAASRGLFQPGSNLVFDFSETGEYDSAAVALLVEWWRRAQQAGCDIRFQAVPAGLLAIARLSEVQDLLPLAR